MIKTEVNGFSKPSETGPLLNTDASALTSYKKQKHLYNTIKILDSRINTLEQRIATIETANGTSNST